MTMPTWDIRQGNALERLREMPDESVHCVVTSPPYWGLRDYGVVALRHGRSFIGIELNPGYIELARKRIIGDAPLLNSQAESRVVEALK